MRPSPTACAGVTLLEMLIVVLILGIVSMVAIPGLTGALRDARLNAAAAEVVNALEFARMTAMSSGQKTQVSVTTLIDTIAVRRYKPAADLFKGGDELAAGAVEAETWEYLPYPLRKGAQYVITFSQDDRFKGTRITWSDLAFITPVNFDSRGTPSRGGVVRLTRDNSERVVELNALNGAVTVRN